MWGHYRFRAKLGTERVRKMYPLILELLGLGLLECLILCSVFYVLSKISVHFHSLCDISVSQTLGFKTQVI